MPPPFPPREYFGDPNSKVVHVYGELGDMNGKDIMRYLGGSPVRVRWLDDSCCNVEYADTYSAYSAIARVAAVSDYTRLSRSSPYTYTDQVLMVRLSNPQLDVKLQDRAGAKKELPYMEKRPRESGSKDKPKKRYKQKKPKSR